MHFRRHDISFRLLYTCVLCLAVSVVRVMKIPINDPFLNQVQTDVVVTSSTGTGSDELLQEEEHEYDLFSQQSQELLEENGQLKNEVSASFTEKHAVCTAVLSIFCLYLLK